MVSAIFCVLGRMACGRDVTLSRWERGSKAARARRFATKLRRYGELSWLLLSGGRARRHGAGTLALLAGAGALCLPAALEDWGRRIVGVPYSPPFLWLVGLTAGACCQGGMLDVGGNRAPALKFTRRFKTAGL